MPHTITKTTTYPIQNITIQKIKLETTVRLLLEVEPDSDPVWHYINIQSDADNSQLIDCTGTEADALRGRYIRWLTTVLIHHIPAFWKVTLSVCNEKFGKVKQRRSIVLVCMLHMTHIALTTKISKTQSTNMLKE